MKEEIEKEGSIREKLREIINLMKYYPETRLREIWCEIVDEYRNKK